MDKGNFSSSMSLDGSPSSQDSDPDSLKPVEIEVAGEETTTGGGMPLLEDKKNLDHQDSEQPDDDEDNGETEAEINRQIDEEIAAYRATHRFGQLDPELAASLEAYLEELRLKNQEAARKPKPPLPEHPRKYERNAGNCVTFSNGSFGSPAMMINRADPAYAKMVENLKRDLEEIEKEREQKQQQQKLNNL